MNLVYRTWGNLMQREFVSVIVSCLVFICLEASDSTPEGQTDTDSSEETISNKNLYSR